MIVVINDKGRTVADAILKEMPQDVCSIADIGGRWNVEREIIFIGALGICVRSIAPYITDKHSDPAVVCIDTLGCQVISVLSGHVGGANVLTRKLAKMLDATPVITTQSDLQGLWSLDTLASEYGWADYDTHINEQIALFVACEPTALLLDVEDEGTQYLRDTLPAHVTIVDKADDITPDRFRLAVIVSPMEYMLSAAIAMVQYIPRCVHVGIGLSHQASPAEEVLGEILNALSMSGVCLESIVDYNTIDKKADEPVVKLLQSDGMTVNFYTASQLDVVDVPNPSNVVQRHVGTKSVSEASCLMNGKMLTAKQKGTRWTVATSIDNDYVKESVEAPAARACCKRYAIEIVGAGPGDPDLISVRGKQLVAEADLILYAGSLVPVEVTDNHKPGAEVLSSADMTLEQQIEIMKTYYDKGKRVVRLHTGDPCIYGAIQEQMNWFDRYGMEYRITPGISSFLAAAAALRSQFTIPERCQTIILTRGEGRTPMPDKEQLHKLAAHQSTMCIFLSATLADKVQEELIKGGYSSDTPVAVCHKLTWPDQAIYRGKLADLASIIRDNKLTLTTMIVVGDAIDNRQGLSRLYDKGFEHKFRNSH